MCRLRPSCGDTLSTNSHENGLPQEREAAKSYATKLDLEHRGAGHRAKRIAAALTLFLVEARDKRARGGHRALDRHRAAGIAVDLLAHLVHPAAFGTLLADRRPQRR